MIDNMFENQPDLPKETHLETSKFYIDKGISVSQGIIKEKINTMQLSKTAKSHYEKAAQEVIDYYLKDYRKLKKKLEKELEAEKQWLKFGCTRFHPFKKLRRVVLEKVEIHGQGNAEQQFTIQRRLAEDLVDMVAGFPNLL